MLAKADQPKQLALLPQATLKKTTNFSMVATLPVAAILALASGRKWEASILLIPCHPAIVSH